MHCCEKDQVSCDLVVVGEICFIYLWFQFGFIFALSMSLIQGPAPHSDNSS